ncbi:MAG TPA: HAD-IIB family hydrolase [Candidatus Paceibacterota bacterium]
MIIFDLDGTLAESKQTLDAEMLALLKRLLQKDSVAVISGCAFIQFQLQILDHIDATPKELENLFFFPTNAAAFYRYDKGDWKKVYEETLSDEEVAHISKALNAAETELDIKEEKVYGDKIEWRAAQVTYSGIGQKAPIEPKKIWDPDHAKRAKIVAIVAPLIPEFEVRIAGATSIDITRKGRDKAYGIRQIEKYLNVKREDMTFVGDSLFEGGNDYPVIATGVYCVHVKEVEDTKRFIRDLVG